ncbi:Hypothetical protein ORPV_858 [Orpheovirus IHUMI-LCC2]|uniref:Uncharacterized protein n=1 Tax=Orpheovirus IHUMI-LCC2 TaxID=2023057 RepID=A0A2I2L5D8_9VIRU|nr:Hypothetical protein ORPV_858 [Orpheovirus IHUMI-LCC2]SNW62762.1 Hypothetical protein ORPV_858 [Orpheovirus IHUMI-LCC2]
MANIISEKYLFPTLPKELNDLVIRQDPENIPVLCEISRTNKNLSKSSICTDILRTWYGEKGVTIFNSLNMEQLTKLSNYIFPTKQFILSVVDHDQLQLIIKRAYDLNYKKEFFIDMLDICNREIANNTSKDIRLKGGRIIGTWYVIAKTFIEELGINYNRVDVIPLNPNVLNKISRYNPNDLCLYIERGGRQLEEYYNIFLLLDAIGQSGYPRFYFSKILPYLLDVPKIMQVPDDEYDDEYYEDEEDISVAEDRRLHELLKFVYEGELQEVHNTIMGLQQRTKYLYTVYTQRNNYDRRFAGYLSNRTQFSDPSIYAILMNDVELFKYTRYFMRNKEEYNKSLDAILSLNIKGGNYLLSQEYNFKSWYSSIRNDVPSIYMVMSFLDKLSDKTNKILTYDPLNAGKFSKKTGNLDINVNDIVALFTLAYFVMPEDFQPLIDLIKEKLKFL